MSKSVPHHKVCIVGAGPCGLTAIQQLKSQGIEDIICHEAMDTFGGLWAFSEDPDRPSVYDSAHIISSRQLSTFRDFPMPDEYPDFPSQRQILAYFQSYENLHNLSEYIRFESRIDRAERMADGGWSLSVSDKNGTHQETTEHLIVAAGHHRIPSTPAIASDFKGDQIHSSQYRRTTGFEGKRVLVVGAGNSACDIASALARVSEHVSLSMRTPQYIVPKTLLGRPVDVQYRKMQWIPRSALNFLFRLALPLIIGRYERYGLPQPTTEVLSSHPTLSTDILELLMHGKIAVRGETKAISGTTVEFSEGDASDFDTIIWATGYKTKFPFLADPQFDWSESLRLPLYQKIFPVDVDDIYFVGLIQPLGCIWALADYQSELIANAIAGKWHRPRDIKQRLAREHARDAAQYSNTTRHAVEVDYHEYKKVMLRELGA